MITGKSISHPLKGFDIPIKGHYTSYEIGKGTFLFTEKIDGSRNNKHTRVTQKHHKYLLYFDRMNTYFCLCEYLGHSEFLGNFSY